MQLQKKMERAVGVLLKASAIICQGMHAEELDGSVKSAQRFRS